MRGEIMDLIGKFIKICDLIYKEGKIDEKKYRSLTKNKIDFLEKLRK